MATLNSFSIPLMAFLLYSSLLFLCFPEQSQALESHFHTLDFGSLSPASESKHDLQHSITAGLPTAGETISNHDTNTLTLPVLSGRYFETDKYCVTLGVGSPKQELSLAFNTITNLIWFRCSDTTSVIRQDLYFNTLASHSYQNISCSSPHCTNFLPNQYHCSHNSSCAYTSKYDDQSASDGFLTLDQLNTTHEFSEFLFFCIAYNPTPDTVSPNAGLLGLGRGALSFVSQFGIMYNNYFHYCLPSNSSYKGYLTLGTNNTGNNRNNPVKFTPLIPSTDYPSYYFVRITSIDVGSINLPVLLNFTIAVDSGTSITRLPEEAYVSLRDEFRRQMGGLYPILVPSSIDIFDTCYCASCQKIRNTPNISFTFEGGVVVDLDDSQIFREVDSTAVCLAFANNTNPPFVSIFGSTQQKKMEVVFDVAGEQLGFRPNACH